MSTTMSQSVHPVYAQVLEEQVYSAVKEGVEVFGFANFKVLISDAIRSTAQGIFKDGVSYTSNSVALALEEPILRGIPQTSGLRYRAVELVLPILYSYMTYIQGVSAFEDKYKFVFHMLDTLDFALEHVI